MFRVTLFLRSSCYFIANTSSLKHGQCEFSSFGLFLVDLFFLLEKRLAPRLSDYWAKKQTLFHVYLLVVVPKKHAVCLSNCVCVCHGKAHMMEYRVTGSHVNVSALREFTLDYAHRCARP